MASDTLIDKSEAPNSLIDPELEPLIGPDEVGHILNQKAGTLARWRCTGRVLIPYVKIGGRVKYKPSDIKAFIAKNTKLHSGGSLII